MQSSADTKKTLQLSGKIGIVLTLIAAALLSGGFRGTSYITGLVLVITGQIALSLAGFSFSEISAAFRHAAGQCYRSGEMQRSRYFWGAAARNVLSLGVLGTLVGFVLTTRSFSGGPSLFLAAFGDTVLSTLCGLILASVFSILTLLINERIEAANGSTDASGLESASWPESSGLGWERWLGYGLLSGLILWLGLSMSVGGAFPWEWFANAPALMLVVGGALLLGILLGNPASGCYLTLGFAYSGVIGALFGLIQAFHGFAQISIEAISSALGFIISSCLAGLAGMLIVGFPLEDRAARLRRYSAVPAMSRIAWYGFPLVALVFLAFVVAMVVTPVTKG